MSSFGISFSDGEVNIATFQMGILRSVNLVSYRSRRAMTALDGEHDPLLTALRSARFDSLQDTTLLGFSPSEHSAAGNAICCISLFGKVFIIDRWC